MAKTETDTRALSLNAKELIEKAKFQNAKEGKVFLTFVDQNTYTHTIIKKYYIH